MSAEKLKTLIMSHMEDVVFVYGGKNTCITPFNDKKYEVCFGDDVKEFTSIDILMNDPFFDGKSLNEIANMLEI